MNEITVVVSGAAGGIGLAIARAFLKGGARIVAIDRDEAGLARLRQEAPTQVDAVVADVADYKSLVAVAEGREVDHVIGAAACGSGKTGNPFWNLEPADWKRVIDVTLMGTVHLVHAFAPALRRGTTADKSVILLTSVAGQIGSPTDPPYSASKAAVISFVQVAAKDFAPYGVRVNALSPGMVRSELSRRVFEASPESSSMTYEQWGAEKVQRVAPLGRWQEPEEFGAMAVFLASHRGRNITGQTINIDGGQVMHS